MEIKIISYQPNYFSRLFALLKNVYDSTIDQENLEKNYVDGVNSIILAVDSESDKVVGCAFLQIRIDYIRDEQLCFVTYVAVDATYRKRGIGRMLFNEVENRAIQADCKSIELTSANYREDAHSFYESIGFSKKKTTIFIKECVKHQKSR